MYVCTKARNIYKSPQEENKIFNLVTHMGTYMYHLLQYEAIL